MNYFGKLALLAASAVLIANTFVVPAKAGIGHVSLSAAQSAARDARDHVQREDRFQRYQDRRAQAGTDRTTSVAR